MIFKPELAALVVAGQKTQTRRLWRPGDSLTRPTETSLKVVTARGRARWRTGQILAVQPGRGKPQIAKIQILDLWRENLIDISLSDARAEGFETRDEFWRKWLELIGATTLGLNWRESDAKSQLVKLPSDFTSTWAISFRLFNPVTIELWDWSPPSDAQLPTLPSRT